MSLPLSPLEGIHTVELTADDAPLLQRFFEANSPLFLATTGEAAGPNEAYEEITSEVPAEMSFTRKCVVGYVGGDGALVAMANIVSDLLAKSIHHLGTFIVATELHGTGRARLLYDGLERWAVADGAAWLRLGVVRGNTRAERF